MINGKQLRDAFISGANSLCNRKNEVDKLNVFPVPDGDTGTNMSMTVSNALEALSALSDDVTVAEVSKTASGAFLRGARGNSGVITSLLFRGFAKGLKDKETADGSDIANAFSLGVDAAYKAVMKPTEGTILTVARCAAEKAVAISKYDDSVTAVFYGMFIAGKKALAQTPEMLPILKKSGVVDAGGQGLVYMMEGMWHLIAEGNIVAPSVEETPIEETADGIASEYCVKIVINKCTCKEADFFRRNLAEQGDVIDFVPDDNSISAHIHTEEPGKVITEALTYGSLDDCEIKNLTKEICNCEKNADNDNGSLFPYAEVNPDIKFGFVSVCAGKGLTEVFSDLGCDNIVSGGQTMNPSTEDILAAIQATPAKTVFVLPNNKNIIMAAMQAAELADRETIVIPSRTVPQGISAMLSYDPDSTAKDNTDAMNEALSSVATGSVTFAARDSEFDGHKIKEGELLAMKEGKMLYTGKDMDIICYRLTKELVTKETSMVTVYYGEDISVEQAEKIRNAIVAKISSDIEVAVVYGGQPVYYFIISAE